MTPFQLFLDWYHQELKQSDAAAVSACCLSTKGLDDYPSARFVSLKELADETFIITGPVTSRKGLEIMQSDKVAITFWWTATQRQVRIQGNATKITDRQADKYFTERASEAQIISLISEQGKPLQSPDLLSKKFWDAKAFFSGKRIPRPGNWGGYGIRAVRIEFMEFKTSRFHDRSLFERVNEQWTVTQIQP